MAREPGLFGQVEQDVAAQRRDAVAGAAAHQPHRLGRRHADADRAAQQLHELLGEPGRCFRIVRELDLAAIVPLDRRTRQRHQVGGLHHLFNLGVAELVDGGVHVLDQGADRSGQFLPHPDLAAGVADRTAPGLPAPGAGPQPQQGEPVAHGRDHRVRRIPCGGDGGDDHDAAGPGQRLAAIGPDVAFPAPVIDFPDRGQDAGAGVAVGAQDRW